MLEEYQLRKSQLELERTKLKRLKSAKTASIDGVEVHLQANIELPSDVPAALEGGAEGVGLFRTDSSSSIAASCRPRTSSSRLTARWSRAWTGGRSSSAPSISGPTRISTGRHAGRSRQDESGARHARDPRFAGRAEDVPDAVAGHPASLQYGKVKLLIPMLAHAHEIDATLAAVEQAKSSLRGEKVGFDPSIEIGGMIEIPAAALGIGLSCAASISSRSVPTT